LLQQDQGNPRLQLTVWDTHVRGDEFVKAAEAHLGGDYTEIGVAMIAASGNQQRFAVALRGVRGDKHNRADPTDVGAGHTILRFQL
jgi:hypothetical protein